jgi:hypothetical protein
MATEVVTAEGAAPRVVSDARPYRTGWADAIVAALERLPGPTWLAYAGLGLVGIALILAEGATHRLGLGALQPTYFFYLFFYLFPLAAYHYLSRGARAAWDAFRPATDLDPAAAARVRLELSSTPYVPVAAIWLVVAAINALMEVAIADAYDLANQPPAYLALRIGSESLWVFPMVMVLIYLVIRQLRLISRLHASIERVDLLRPTPLHAMSRLTARSAIAIVVVAIASGLPLPGIAEAALIATVLSFSLPLLILAALAFVAPLRGMQQRLAREKARREAEISLRIDAASDALHRLVDDEAANRTDADASRLAQTRIDALNKALASLIQERDFIKRQSAWPWDGGTFRAVASAIALPILLFLVTRLLERFV